MSDNPFHPKLRFIGKPIDGQIYELEPGTTSVGRGTENLLSLQHSSVSMKHCEILANDAEVIVRDLQSSNGTFVNGHRVTGQMQIKHGQVIRIGSVSARLEMASPLDDEPASEISAIGIHARVVREQEKKRDRPEQSPAPVTIGNAAQGDGEHTRVIPVEQQNQPLPPAHSGSLDSAAPKKGKKGGYRWLVAGLLFGLVLLIWYLTR